jgi:uncharacterized protein (DUF885 family)
MTATSLGVPGSDHLWDDLSPAGHQRHYELARRYRQMLEEHLEHPDPDQRLAAVVMANFLDARIDEFETGDHRRDLAHTYCGLTNLRDIFDIMAGDSADAWSDIALRLRTIGEAWEGWTDLLSEGLAERNLVARRQVESVIEQAETLAGENSRFLDLLEVARQRGLATADLEEAVEIARRQAAKVAEWLRTEYLPHAREEDGVGEELYIRSAERFLGLVLDPHETYSWGWSEIDRIHTEMVAEAAKIDPDSSLAEVLELLEADPDRAVPRERFCEFVEARLRQAVEDLNGEHFDVPDDIRQVTVHLAPPGGALGAWYINPSVDWSRPGSVWYSLGSRTSIPMWQEISTAYHEGFPGHHLQAGIAMYQTEHLSLAHRLLIWYSGYGEGWALYAERLMDELGYFENPDYRLGLLASQQLRAVRVVVDIGTHLGLPIPAGAPLHGGEVWTFGRAVDYVEKVGLQVREVAESEVRRYLGWPGQAISYKVGEREILAIRHALEERPGGLDVKDFHRRVLENGPLRLDHLRQSLLGDT